MDWFLYDNGLSHERLRELNKYLRNDGSAVKNVWLIQFQGKNYMKG